ncbi:hypothetical protein BJ508DRAFT_115407 [Ascobolus immersus RN42]|uniref:Zn(2)-C6 fungal-type domain-containing protein n=1 Tax=Ascobolus immersus RN42 TaxID=1160509 RepID=A0A3N4I533_ASCIM|nr:hypothetical protein BJ508DRAFT_115407 [Ascobolus immersus RN42]
MKVEMASSERDGGAAVMTQPANNLPVSSAESVASSTPATSTTTSTAAKNDKDRPRRRKARRACFACQRAHLTCGTSPLFVSVDLSGTIGPIGHGRTNKLGLESWDLGRVS